MDFSDALKALGYGKKVCRAGWNGKGMWLQVRLPDAHSKMSKPYIYMKAADDSLGPWAPSQADMFANDWQTL